MVAPVLGGPLRRRVLPALAPRLRHRILSALAAPSPVPPGLPLRRWLYAWLLDTRIPGNWHVALVGVNLTNEITTSGAFRLPATLPPYYDAHQWAMSTWWASPSNR